MKAYKNVPYDQWASDGGSGWWTNFVYRLTDPEFVLVRSVPSGVFAVNRHGDAVPDQFAVHPVSDVQRDIGRPLSFQDTAKVSIRSRTYKAAVDSGHVLAGELDIQDWAGPRRPVVVDGPDGPMLCDIEVAHSYGPIVEE